jgi:hypothetical protein
VQKRNKTGKCKNSPEYSWLAIIQSLHFGDPGKKANLPAGQISQAKASVEVVPAWQSLVPSDAYAVARLFGCIFPFFGCSHKLELSTATFPSLHDLQPYTFAGKEIWPLVHSLQELAALSEADPSEHVLQTAKTWSFWWWYFPAIQSEQRLEESTNSFPIEQNLQP